MKKVSILLLAMTMFAMMFTGCSSILGENVNATLEDFQGTWYYKTDDNKEVTLAVTDKDITIIGLGEEQLYHGKGVKDGIFDAISMDDFSTKISLTVSSAKTVLHVGGDFVRKHFPGQLDIIMNKDFDIGSAVSGFVADTTVTMEDYVGTFSGKLHNGKEVEFVFAQLSIPTTDGHLNTINISGLTNQIATGYVVVAKGVATFTVDISGKSHIFTMYMAKDKKTITGTATGLTELAGSKTLKLTKK